MGAKEDDGLSGPADNAALSSSVLLLLAFVLSIAALASPWWVSSNNAGKLASEATVSSTVTLWSLQLQEGYQADDGAGGTTLKVRPREVTWGQLCSTVAGETGGSPSACGNVQGVRVLVVLCAVFAAIGCVSLQLARSVSPLFFLLGSLSAFLTAMWALGALMMAAMVSVGGLQGVGVILDLVTMLSSFLAVSVSFYGAGIAMPVDPPAQRNRQTRQMRVQEQRDKDLEVARQLEENLADRMEEDGGAAYNKKPPEMLKKILFWSEEHGGDADAEGIPTEWLEAAFQEIDDDGSGAIDVDELVDCLNLCGLQASKEATENIMKEIDKNMSGDIDIHEFVEFFRALEELDRFQAKTEQRAQFAQFLCNFCFIAHFIIVGALLMMFIGMEEDEDPDNYLIFKNMLLAFSVVLSILLVSVICLPAARLTLGSNVSAWERQYNIELQKRMDRKPKTDDDDEEMSGPNLRAAASTGSHAADGLADLTVNAAVFGASYRVSKQSFFQQSQLPDLLADPNERRGSRASRKASRMSTSSASSGAAEQSIFKTKDGGFERYKPEAYEEAAQRAAERNAPVSFSPMQVQNMDMPRQEPQIPGSLALDDEPAPGGLTGTGFYHRAL